MIHYPLLTLVDSMLLSLQIENFALIDHLHLALGEGLTVLTGETGAGKSIILDALDAVLGGKVSGRAVRTGAEKAVLEASFRLDAPLRQWLKEQAIALPGETLVCSREIAAAPGSPRSRSRVNGVAVTKQQMDALRDRLVELTAQGQTVQLGEPNAQRDWLDHYGGSALMQQRDRVATAFAAFQSATQVLEQRRRAEQQRLQQLDLFEYQLQELNAANLTDGDELERLEQEAKRLVHSVELQQQSYAVYQALYQSDRDQVTCTDLLGQAERILLGMVEYDEQLQPIVDLVTAALAQVEEAGREINAYGADIEADPQRLSEVQARITELKQICRKYGPELADAIALRDRLQQDVMEMTGGGQSMEELEAAVAATQASLLDQCAHLTHQRTTAALDLQTRLVQELKPLAMEKVQFTVDIAPCAPTAAGADQVTFLFSPNPGEPLQPLTEIASGGEMSRFLLALQASFSQIDPVGTLVFDEIDAGVSGRVTQAIAEKLYHLSHHHQVLCVTHQPIVAAMADQHLHVSKHLVTDGGSEGSVDITLSMTMETNGHSNGQVNGHGNGKKANGKRGRAAQSQTAADSPTPALTERSPDSSIRTVVRVNPLTTEERKHELALLAGGQLAQESSTATEAAAYTFAESLLTQAENLRRSPTTIVDPVPLAPAQTPAARASSAPGQANRKEPATAAIAKSSRNRSSKKSS